MWRGKAGLGKEIVAGRGNAGHGEARRGLVGRGLARHGKEEDRLNAGFLIFRFPTLAVRKLYPVPAERPNALSVVPMSFQAPSRR